MSNTEDQKKQNTDILIKACILAQNKGALSLKDASVVHEAIRSLTSEKKTLEEKSCIDALVQASVLGQKGGAYSLDDANAVFHAVKWFDENKQEEQKIQEVKEL